LTATALPQTLSSKCTAPLLKLDACESKVVNFLAQTSLKLLYWTRLIYKIEEVNLHIMLHTTPWAMHSVYVCAGFIQDLGLQHLPLILLAATWMTLDLNLPRMRTRT
jgi:hypothetical protein